MPPEVNPDIQYFNGDMTPGPPGWLVHSTDHPEIMGPGMEQELATPLLLNCKNILWNLFCQYSKGHHIVFAIITEKFAEKFPPMRAGGEIVLVKHVLVKHTQN